jgi:hypothetical protein
MKKLRRLSLRSTGGDEENAKRNFTMQMELYLT